MILVLTQAWDQHADRAIEMLKAKGGDPIRFQTEDLPQKIDVVLRFGEGQGTSSGRHVLRIDDRAVDLSAVTAVWFRRPAPPLPVEGLKHEDRRFVLNETSHVLGSLWRLLQNRFWVNPMPASNAAEHKPYQLKTAEEIGFRVPRTLVTNKPELVADFFERCGGEIIYKSFSSHARTEDSRSRAIYTSRVTKSALDAHLAQVRLAPCLFQEYVQKAVEFRVTVVGDTIFTDEIRSQESAVSQVDWRRHYMEDVPHRASDLPATVKAKIQLMVQRLGLVFGCIDLILTPQGEFVFLELNPNGQWHWVEDLTGMPLCERFTDLLLNPPPSLERHPL